MGYFTEICPSLILTPLFESILIRPHSNEDVAMDYGQVIENLFFYQNTIVHLNRGSIAGLVHLADTPVLEELLKYQGLQMHYNNSHATVMGPVNGIYTVDTIGLSDLDIEKELYEQYMFTLDDELKAKKFSRKLSRLINVYELPFNLKTTFDQELQDTPFLKDVLDETIQKYYPNNTTSPADRRFELEYINARQFRIHTNLDSNQPDQFHDTSPILSLINSCADLHVMAEYGSEICLPEFNSKIVRLKVDTILDKTQASAAKISRFNIAQFNEARALREAINSKQLHVKAILPVLRKATRYKEWLQNLSDDSDLMYEYLDKIEEKSILERMNFKAIKFYLFTGIQTILAAGTPPEFSIPANTAISAFDTFISDKLTENWKPSQFVREDYKKLLK